MCRSTHIHSRLPHMLLTYDDKLTSVIIIYMTPITKQTFAVIKVAKPPLHIHLPRTFPDLRKILSSASNGNYYSVKGFIIYTVMYMLKLFISFCKIYGQVAV